ncbi:hypothetical protein BZG36_01507 [Bifiguratus adelaidae]|uniref:BZIP domain-containing protein n=1 Tax=Bifiguratus adelaidae TaxID=1938954 RepID=A0A261Y4T8_9FUNG|nr:hypothetical protein BZG36_01507 [Bifiguratus adelaidae]
MTEHGTSYNESISDYVHEDDTKRTKKRGSTDMSAQESQAKKGRKGSKTKDEVIESTEQHDGLGQDGSSSLSPGANSTLLSLPSNSHLALQQHHNNEHESSVSSALPSNYDTQSLVQNLAMIAPVAGISSRDVTSLLQNLQGTSVIPGIGGNNAGGHDHGRTSDSDGDEDQLGSDDYGGSNAGLSGGTGHTQGKRGPNARGLTENERRQRRLMRNRVAAKECRKKKKAYITDLEEKVQKLEDEISRLRKENQELSAKITLGAMQGSEGYALIKQVAELNAKLSMQQMHEAALAGVDADGNVVRHNDGHDGDKGNKPEMIQGHA